MADANVIAGGHPHGAVWKEIYGCQAEAMSLVELWYGNGDADAVATLASALLERFCAAVDKLERPPIDWGVGAVAPTVTQEVDSQ